MELKNKEHFMKLALIEAKKAQKKNEVPIGAVIVRGDRVISKAHNLREKTKNSLKHAEIMAIDKACKKLKNFRLEDCELYVTIEPCLMCAGAIVQSRIKKVYFGAADEKFGAVISATNAFEVRSNHKVAYEDGILEKECQNILREFFKELREEKSKR